MAHTVEYEITESDVVTFHEACEGHAGMYRSIHRIGFLLFAILVIAFAMALVRPPFGTAIVGTAVAVGCLLLLHPFVWPLDYRFNLRRALKRGHLRTALGRHTLTLEPGGVRERREAAEIFHAWSGVQALRAEGEYFYILVGPDTGYIVPKRSFADSAAAETFWRRVSELWQAGRQQSGSAWGGNSGRTSGCS